MAGTRDPVGEVERGTPGQRSGPIPTLDHLEGRQIGRYLVSRRLGGGGVATVYQAFDQVLGQTVALKLLPPHPDAGTLDRFRREALMAGALRHPHIVRIFQVGTSARGGAAYMAMELVEGESLAGFLARQGALRPAESCNLLEPVARALAFAHEHGIVHRDVKPGNILLRPVSPGTPYSVQLMALDHPVIPLLSDFGVARFLDAPELTSTGRTVGTPAFMAPEQCVGSREIDGRADIYALGTVLFRCVVGRLPFTGSMTQVLHAQVYEPVVIEDHLLRQLGPVATILRRCLAKEPGERYVDAAHLADELAEAAQRTGGGYPRSGESGQATATLTLATLEAISAQEPSIPVTVLVPGAAAAGRVPTFPDPPARPVSPRGLRWGGMAAAVALTVLLGTLGVWVWSWRNGNQAPPATPAGLAVLAPSATATREEPAGSHTEAPITPSVVAASVLSAAATPETQAEATGNVTPQSVAESPTALPTPSPAPALEVLPTSTAVLDAPVPDTPVPATPIATVSATPPPPAETPVQPAPQPDVGRPGVEPPPQASGQEDAVAVVCANVVDEYLMGVMDRVDPAVRESFRCPTAPAYGVGGSLLSFAGGYMLALDASPYVYVYYQATGEWEQVIRRDETAPGSGVDADGLPSPFGQVWRENQRSVVLGDPATPNPTAIDGLVQVFTGGMLVADRSTGAVYAFPLDRLRL